MRVFGGKPAPPPTGTAARPIGVAAKPHSNPTSLTSSQALAALIPAPTPNFARNSPTTLSNFEFRSLELLRFRTSLKLHPIELRATFSEARPCHHPPVPRPVPITTPQSGHASGKKFSQHAQNTPKSALFRQQGEFCHGPIYESPPPGATPTAQTSRGVRTRHNAGGTLAT